MQTAYASSNGQALFTLSRVRFDGVLFDLDGVVTNTAKVHALAWKSMFDEFLQQWSANTGSSQRAFDVIGDYARYLDGLPRQEGIARFLASRGIVLPQGKESDAPGTLSMLNLGKQKNALLLKLVRQHGVDVYPSSVDLLQALRQSGYRIAVVSSSANCQEFLDAAGLRAMFDARVDGVDLARGTLRGKPAPDTFLEAARRLQVPPLRAAVIEDAVAGIEAGHAGGFGAVIAVDRLGRADALAQAGATVVVKDLCFIAVAEHGENQHA